MRILALSDLHGMMPAMDQLVQVEAGKFDAVVFAGDICGRRSDVRAILEPLRRYRCPVLVVYGNWDARLEYDADLGVGHHLHGRPVSIGGYRFVGFSGCDANWGRNPIAAAMLAERRAVADAAVAESAPRRRGWRAPLLPGGVVQAANLAALAEEWRASDHPAERTVVVSHERCRRLGEYIPGAALHLFGHRHEYKLSRHLGTTYVNVSGMGLGQQAGTSRRGAPELRGNWVTIDVGCDGIEARSHDLFGIPP